MHSFKTPYVESWHLDGSQYIVLALSSQRGRIKPWRSECYDNEMGPFVLRSTACIMLLLLTVQSSVVQGSEN